ncbi:MAG: IPT/TIG domain-containing protein, partial [Patescibacteria group bacterium]
MKKYTLIGFLFVMVAVFGFNYVPVHAVGSPAISRISPTSVPIDSTYDATRVIIYGLNFDQDSYVAFDGIRGIAINPDSQSATGLLFYVPTSTTVGVHTIQVGQRNSYLPLSNSISLTTTVTPKAATSADDKALLNQITLLLTQINATKAQLGSVQSATGQAPVSQSPGTLNPVTPGSSYSAQGAT